MSHAEVPHTKEAVDQYRIYHQNVMDRSLVWRFEGHDRAWPPGFAKTKATEFQAMLERMASTEGRKMREVWLASDKRCHKYPVTRLKPGAKKRLEELDLDDVSDLYTLGVGAKFRLVGVLREHIFYVLWIDPLHEVWPVDKRHT